LIFEVILINKQLVLKLSHSVIDYTQLVIRKPVLFHKECRRLHHILNASQG